MQWTADIWLPRIRTKPSGTVSRTLSRGRTLYRGGLVFEAQRLLYHSASGHGPSSTCNESKKEKKCILARKKDRQVPRTRTKPSDWAEVTVGPPFPSHPYAYLTMLKLTSGVCGTKIIAASVYDERSVGPSIRPICSRCWLRMTDVIQECSYFIEPGCFVTENKNEAVRHSDGAEIVVGLTLALSDSIRAPHH